MAELTSDIVWLVEQSVTLADGSTQRVLVPQVYVRVKPGDIDGGGALLSANDLRITTAPGSGTGNVTNTGTLAGRSLVSITADNIDNLGGRIVGGNVGLNARNDLNNIGGSIEARNAAVLTAGHDVNIRTTTSSQTGAQGSRTAIDRVAGVYVTNPGGTLIASAGSDVNLVGAILSNTGANSYTEVHAGRDINLGTVTTSSTQDTTWNAKNYRRSAESQEIGSQIIGGSVAGSSVMLDADRHIVARQAAVQTEGLLSVHADGNIDIQAGRRTQSVDEAHQNTARSGLSKRTTTSRDTLDESISQGSSFQGGITAITADGNIVGEGVKIRGTDGVLVQAGGTLDLHEARDVRMESHEVSVQKSGFGLGGGSIPMVVPKKNASRDASTTYSNTAAVTTIESSNGGVLLKGDQRVALRGVQIDAAKDITVKGGSVSITGAVNESATTSEHYQKDLNLGTETWWRDPGTGINAQRTDAAQRQETSLVRSTLNGANVTLSATGANGEGGTLLLAGTTINTPGKLTLEADKLVLGTQTTKVDTSHTSQGRDVMWQKAQGEGTSDQTTHYNQFNVGQLVTNANSVQAGLGARDSIQSLGQQPGMGWVNQINADPKLAGKVDWVKVEEAHTQWDYKKQGLTPEGAAIVTLVAAYFAFPAAQGAGAAAGNAAAVGAGEGVAMAGGGTFLTASGVTISGVAGGAVTAGLTALASQVAVATINNRGNPSGTLHDLGSSENVKGLLTAIVTGGVLGGLNLNPTGQPTVGGGAEKFMNQLGQNLQAGAAKAVIGTAINGGSFEENLKDGLKSAFIDTLAAQGANQIGDWTQAGTLNDVTNKIAHAIAGCAIGAAKADSASGCGAGALGATMGELSAELYGRNIDTVQFASMMGGIAAAIAGGDAKAINLASQTAANAAANNYLNHDQWGQFAKDMQGCGKDPVCEATQRAKYAQISKDQDAALAVCDKVGNCDTLKAQVAEGRAYQIELVKNGALPNYVLGGFDLQQVGLKLANQPAYREQVGKSVIAQLICQLDQSACDVQSAKMAIGLGVALAGGPAASYLLSSLPAIAAAAKMTASACAASPVICANQAGVVVADLLVGEALGGAGLAGGAFGLRTLSKVEAEAEALRLIAKRNATLSAKVDNAILNRADSLLYNDLAARAKIRPDTSMDAIYVAKTDTTILADNKFDMAHVLTGEINASGKATGYHAEVAANGEARITPGGVVTQNANGTYEAPVQIWDGAKMEWIDKKNISTFFPPSWSEARITYEVTEAFKTKVMLSGQKWSAATPSGIVVEGFSNANRTTFYPTGTR